MFVGRAAMKTAGGAVKDASTAAGGAAKRSVARAAQTAQQTVKAAMAKAGATARQRRSRAAADRAATTTIEEMAETPVEMEPIGAASEDKSPREQRHGLEQLARWVMRARAASPDEPSAEAVVFALGAGPNLREATVQTPCTGEGALA